MAEEGSAPSAPSAGPAPSAAPGGEGTTATPEAAALPAGVTLEELREFAKSKGGKLRMKANGQEQLVDWDEAERYIPLGKGAYGKFEEGAAKEKRGQELVEQANRIAQTVFEAPDEVLRRMKPEQREAWLRKIAGALKEDQLPAEQRELLEAKRELERLRREDQARREKDEGEQRSAEQQRMSLDFQRLFASTMDEANVSKNPTYRRQLMGRMAGIARRALAAGKTDMTPAQALRIAQSEIAEPARETVQGASLEDLESMLGPEQLQKLVARALAKQGAGDPIKQAAPGATAPRRPPPEPPRAVTGVGDYSALLDSLETKRR
jgi:truncated hemoglobin YjbI